MKYRALAALLSYPSAELIEALPEIAAVLKAEKPDALLGELATRPLVQLEESYVALFDRSRALSLHLFEHVHGESRDRGQAMVDLQAMYAERGFVVAAHELPDFIPAFLEYLSLVEPGAAQKLLKDTTHILRVLGERLAERGSAYAQVFGALLRLAGEPALKAMPVRAAPESAEALDAQWMDPEVKFGPPEVAPIKLYRKGVPA